MQTSRFFNPKFFSRQNILRGCFQKKKKRRNPVYCSKSTNNPHPLFLFLFIFCFYAYFRLGQVRQRLGLPRRVRKEVQLWLRSGQNQKKNKKGRYLCSESKTRDIPYFFLTTRDLTRAQSPFYRRNNKTADFYLVCNP